jgi:hypothetical protein
MTPRHAFLLVLLATISLAACGGDEDRESLADAPDASTPSPSPSASPAPGDHGGTPIRLTFGESQLTGTLHDNATARDLATQLPLTLTFRDHNSVEKTAPLPRELSLDGAPRGHDPTAGDIGYWAPDGDFVLYYDDGAPYFDGIVRIGAFDGDLGTLEGQSDGFTVSVERAR